MNSAKRKVSLFLVYLAASLFPNVLSAQLSYQQSKAAAVDPSYPTGKS